MGFTLATTSTWFLIGPIATVLGYVMNWIYEGINAIGLPNIGLAIIIFTLVIKLLLIPLSIKQQKYSKLQSIITPQVKKIQEKYKGKTDNASVMAQQKETKELYAQYGTSPTGGCLQTLIQMPILFALYQVIYHLPGYITKLKEYYSGIAKVLMGIKGYAENEALQALAAQNTLTATKSMTVAQKLAEENYVIDMMYNFTRQEWTEGFLPIFNNPQLTSAYEAVAENINKANNFLGIDLTMTPMQQLWPAIFIPILAGGLQWLSSKLMQDSMSTASSAKDNNGSMMKTMNYMFPLMSVVFCFMFNCGIGLYWVASSGIQVIIQLIVNAYMNKVDLNDMVAKNLEKVNAKRAKKGLAPVKVQNVSNLMTSLDEMQKQEEEKKQSIAEQTKEASAYYERSSTAKKGSLAEKAGMVQQYDERMKEMRGKSGKR